MTDFDKFVKGKNLDAHIAVLLEKQKAQELILGSIVLETETQKSNLQNIGRDIEAALDKLTKTRKESETIKANDESRKAQLDKKEVELSELEFNLKKEKENFESKKKEDLATIAEERNKLNEDKDSLESKIKELQSEYDSKFKTYTDNLKSLEDDIVDKLKQSDEIRTLLDTTLEGLSEAQNSILSTLKLKDDTILDLEETKEKKNFTIKNLEEREKAVTRREKDVIIIINRMKKKHDSLFPNRKLNI